jgi:hypothetical protein
VGGKPAAGRFNLPVALAIAPGTSPSLLIADAADSELKRFSIEGKSLAGSKLAGRPVSVSGAPEGIAIPSLGILMLGGKTLTAIPFDQTDEVAADQAATLTLKHPVAIYPWHSDWLATDNDHGAVFMIVNGKARVLAGICSTSGPLHGFRDENGQGARFGKLGGIVADGKGIVYVADTANNSIRRVDISEIRSN